MISARAYTFIQGELVQLFGVSQGYIYEPQRVRKVLLRVKFHRLRLGIPLHGEAFQEVEPVISPRIV